MKYFKYILLGTLRKYCRAQTECLVIYNFVLDRVVKTVKSLSVDSGLGPESRS